MLDQPPLSNLQARDVDSVLHPYTPIHKLKTNGPLVISHGKGVYVYDTQGRGYIEGMSGLWCVNVGYGRKELAKADQALALKTPHLHPAPGKHQHQRLIEQVSRQGIAQFAQMRGARAQLFRTIHE